MTKTETQDTYGRWKTEHSMTTKKSVQEKFDRMMEVREKYDRSKNYLETECPWNTGDDTDDGGSYFDLFELHDKAWGMWYRPFQGDDFKSNVKSPMTTGRVESALHRMRQARIGFVAEPTEENDIGKSKIINEVLNHLFTKASLKYKLTTWFKDALIHGTGIARVYYMKKEREVRLAKDKGDVKNMTKEEKLKLEEGQGKVAVFGEKEKIVEYEDIVLEPIPLQEFFPDPNARCIHGDSYTANWVIRRRVISFESFQAEFKDNPNYFDVDRVKPTGYYKDTTLIDEFEFPHDITDGEFVEILECEDVLNDEYDVVANDILIRGSYASHYSPLPYNHKQITYIKIGAIEHPHHFYWKGIADQLLALQGEEEILKNSNYDAMHERNQGKFIINKSDYNKFIEAYKATGGRFVPADSNGRALNQVVEFIQQDPIDPTVFGVLDRIREDATIATQYDPSQLAAPKTDLTATQSLMNQQIVDSFITATLESFSEGLVVAARQIVALMQQFYTVPKVKKITGEDKKDEVKEEFRKLRLENKRINIDGEIVNVEESDEDYEFFEVKGEYLDLRGDLDIRLDASTLQLPNKALDAQMSQQALPQLLPFAVDPEDSESFKKVPIALYNAKKIAQWYVRSNNIPENVLLDKEEEYGAPIKAAIAQNVEMNTGKRVVSVPGEVGDHIEVHNMQLNTLLNEQSRIIDEMIQLDQATGMDEMGNPVENPDIENMKKQLEDIDKLVGIYVDHIEGDKVPLDMQSEYLISKTQPPQQAPMPQGGMPGEMPMEGGMPGGVIPGGAPGMGGMQPPPMPNPGGAPPQVV